MIKTFSMVLVEETGGVTVSIKGFKNFGEVVNVYLGVAVSAEIKALQSKKAKTTVKKP